MSHTSKKAVGALLRKNGVSFRVWAPFAREVSVSGSFNNWQRSPLISEEDGYWAALVTDAQAGQEYKYVITTQDGNELMRNDPRAYQLTSVAGNSVIVDTHFDWQNDADFEARPLQEQVIYELHIGTFNRDDPATTGTFALAGQKLDHLAQLGVTTIELMPVATMSIEHEWWGYTPEYLFSVDNAYGGRYQLLEFVRAAHALGMAVILDVVYNHFGPGNHLDMWQFDGWQENGKGGIYFYNDWRSSTPWGDTRPDFGREEVRDFLLDNVRMWLRDFHLDGLRVDSTLYIRNAIGHNDDPMSDLGDGWRLLQDISNVVHKLKPNGLFVAEDVAVNHYITKAVSDGGAGFMAQWEVTLPHIIREAVEGSDDATRNLSDLCSALNHRYNGSAFERVIYSDSHDSAANGASRLSEEISPGNPGSIYARERSLLAAGLILTAPGVPMLFQGQEFMQGGAFSDWQALDWDKAEQFSGIVLAYRHLIALRKNQYGNTKGLQGQSSSIVHLNESAKVMAYHRWHEGGAGDDVIVIMNFANSDQHEYALNFPRDGVWRVRWSSNWSGYSSDFKSSDYSELVVEHNTGVVTMAPYSVLVLSQDTSASE